MKQITEAQIEANMKAFRTKKGYSQADVAQLLGVSRVTVNNWETSPGAISMRIYLKLAELYGCQVYDFFMA